MKIYLDLVFILNFAYDLLLLMTVDVTLKRYTKLFRLLLASVVGALSLIILFLPFNKFILFFFKILVSVIMIFISFGFKNIKYFLSNMLYLYMSSVILGGFLYLLDIEFSYKRDGLIFYFDGLSINFILLLILGPIILFLYVFEHKKMKSTYNYSYRVNIVFENNKELNVNGFLDTGNKLKDPVTKKYIIILSKKILVPFINNKSPIYVPYKALNKKGLIKCYKIKYIKINKQIFKNYLVGLSDNLFNLNGSEALLNYKLMEDLCLEN